MFDGYVNLIVLISFSSNLIKTNDFLEAEQARIQPCRSLPK